MKNIYMDNAATTRIHDEVLNAMLPYLKDYYGNSLGTYGLGKISKNAIELARIQAAKVINAHKDEIYFTSGGSESDNWALLETARVYQNKGKHIIVSKIEHHAILNTCHFLEHLGFEVTYLDVDSEGFISLQELENTIRSDTILVSIMFANNEIGTIEPVQDIGKICQEKGVLFHCDAVQAFGHEHIDVKAMNIDMLSVSAHKFQGPKGIGFLFIKKGLLLESMIHGGNQERKRRAGTHNTAAIVGLGKACEIALENMDKHMQYERKLRNHLIHRVLDEIPYSKLNGHQELRLSNNANFCFRYIDGESLLKALDEKGVCASSGSACTSGSIEPSHVLLALGIDYEEAHGSLRLTLSYMNTKDEIDDVVEILKDVIKKLREDSYLYQLDMNNHSSSM